jgi:PAS domain S-box-containing protein
MEENHGKFGYSVRQRRWRAACRCKAMRADKLPATRLPQRPEVQPPASGHLSGHEAEPRSAGGDTLAEYGIIFDNAIVGICSTRERVIVRGNRRLEEMFGYEPGELNNHSVVILYPSVEAFERIGRVYSEVLSRHATYTDERVMKRKNGELFWCNVSGKTLDLNNPSRGAIWIFQDISKRKKAEEALQRAHEKLEQRVQERTAELREANKALRAEMAMREKTEQELLASREKYRVLFETFPIGISITDDQGGVIEINQALGRVNSQAMQATLVRELKAPGASLVHPDGSPFTRDQLPSVRALRENHLVADVEVGVRYTNGRTRWFSVTAAPIPVRGYGVVVAHNEITERKRLEEQGILQAAELARASRLNTMGEMAAALAHELGQPLSSTLNYLHGCQLRLDAGEYDEELFRSAVSQAICHAEQAGAIVKQVRQFVRRHKPETVPTNLNAIVEEMVAFLDFERRQRQARIRLSLAKDLPAVPVDPLELKQVMVNLIKNGLEAMAEVPEAARVLEIASRRKGRGWIEISVEDRGPGVGRKDQIRIFDAFFSTKLHGLGLGLAICRSIVESHGGKLTVSRNVHGGATFHFTVAIGK